MKKLLFNLKISKLIYTIILFCNIVLPWKRGIYVQLNIFNCIVITFWTYGVLSHLGYFLKPVSDDENGKVVYETNIPIVQVGFTRIAQVAYFFVFRRDIVDWRVIAGLIVLDVFYVIFMLLDKSGYYYESEDMSSEH